MGTISLSCRNNLLLIGREADSRTRDSNRFLSLFCPSPFCPHCHILYEKKDEEAIALQFCNRWQFLFLHVPKNRVIRAGTASPGEQQRRQTLFLEHAAISVLHTAYIYTENTKQLKLQWVVKLHILNPFLYLKKAGKLHRIFL